MFRKLFSKPTQELNAMLSISAQIQLKNDRIDELDIMVQAQSKNIKELREALGKCYERILEDGQKLDTLDPDARLTGAHHHSVDAEDFLASLQKV